MGGNFLQVGRPRRYGSDGEAHIRSYSWFLFDRLIFDRAAPREKKRSHQAINEPGDAANVDLPPDYKDVTIEHHQEGAGRNGTSAIQFSFVLTSKWWFTAYFDMF